MFRSIPVLLVGIILVTSCAPPGIRPTAAAPNEVGATPTRTTGTPEPDQERAEQHARELFRTRYGDTALNQARIEVQPAKAAWLVIFHEDDRDTYFCIERGTSRIRLSSEEPGYLPGLSNPCDEPTGIERPAPRPATPPAGGPSDLHRRAQQLAREYLLSLSLPTTTLDQARVESRPIGAGDAVTGIRWLVVFHEFNMPCDPAKFLCLTSASEPPTPVAALTTASLSVPYPDIFVCLTAGAEGPGRDVVAGMVSQPVDLSGRTEPGLCPVPSPSS